MNRAIAHEKDIFTIGKNVFSYFRVFFFLVIAKTCVAQAGVMRFSCAAPAAQFLF